MIFSKINSRWLSNINIKYESTKRNVAKCYFNPSIEEEGPRLIKKKKTWEPKKKKAKGKAKRKKVNTNRLKSSSAKDIIEDRTDFQLWA